MLLCKINNIWKVKEMVTKQYNNILKYRAHHYKRVTAWPQESPKSEV
jgi:hypothetical protein